jgi:hypothetical protein
MQYCKLLMHYYRVYAMVCAQGCAEWRHRHGRRVSSPEQDRALQCAQGFKAWWQEEGLQEVLKS